MSRLRSEATNLHRLCFCLVEDLILRSFACLHFIRGRVQTNNLRSLFIQICWELWRCSDIEQRCGFLFSLPASPVTESSGFWKWLRDCGEYCDSYLYERWLVSFWKYISRNKRARKQVICQEGVHRYVFVSLNSDSFSSARVRPDGSIECVCMGRDCMAQQCKGDQCYSSVTVRDGVPSLRRGCLVGPDSRSLTCLASPSASHVIECCARPMCNANASLDSLIRLLLRSKKDILCTCNPVQHIKTMLVLFIHKTTNNTTMREEELPVSQNPSKCQYFCFMQFSL